MQLLKQFVKNGKHYLTMNYSSNYVKLPIKKIFGKIFKRRASQTSAEYCLNSIKTHDYDNFMCTLLLPTESRSSAIAVRAFNIEVSKACEQVTQNSIGLMRLKFWEDAVDNCYKGDWNRVSQHPVGAEMFKAIKNSKLTKRYFNTLISCRVNSLGRNSFATLEDLEKYVEQSVSNVYYLLLEGSGVRSVHADHAASHLGKAQGIVQQLRCTPLAKQLNHIPLPQELLTKHQVSHEDVLRGVSSAQLTECCYEMATRAFQHLNKARSLMASVPREARPVLLPAVVVSHYLDRLMTVQHNVLDRRLLGRAWSWLPRVWWASYRNKY